MATEAKMAEESVVARLSRMTNAEANLTEAEQRIASLEQGNALLQASLAQAERERDALRTERDALVATCRKLGLLDDKREIDA